MGIYKILAKSNAEYAMEHKINVSYVLNDLGINVEKGNNGYIHGKENSINPENENDIFATELNKQTKIVKDKIIEILDFVEKLDIINRIESMREEENE